MFAWIRAYGISFLIQPDINKAMAAMQVIKRPVEYIFILTKNQITTRSPKLILKRLNLKFAPEVNRFP
ncbi:MAG: hypothetical protein K2K84_07235, partial [Muribaculaceae bacterium]|nr:hypothetical protein [Muribaculaceae bacterium]